MEMGRRPAERHFNQIGLTDTQTGPHVWFGMIAEHIPTIFANKRRRAFADKHGTNTRASLSNTHKQAPQTRLRIAVNDSIS